VPAAQAADRCKWAGRARLPTVRPLQGMRAFAMIAALGSSSSTASSEADPSSCVSGSCEALM
jgi:hypothetical protein